MGQLSNPRRARAPIGLDDEPQDELAALLGLAAGGCKPSFERLYHRSSSRLLGIILRINRDRGEAEEVLQETYLKVWHQCGGFDARKSPASYWLASIARHGAIDSLRRSGCRPQTAPQMDPEDDPYAGLRSAAPEPAETLMLRQRAAALQRCLNALPAEQRQSLTLAFHNGMSHSEIACHLDRPLGTVKSWVRRSLMGLKLSLDAESGVPAGSVNRP